MNERTKIAALPESELAQLLIESFFKVGKTIDLSPGKLKIFTGEVYNAQGWMYTDVFRDAFSRYAACQLPEAETLHPKTSPLFISRLMKAYFKKCDERKYVSKPAKDTSIYLTAEEKYNLFFRHTRFYMRMPASPDWVCIYEYMAESKKLAPIPGWEAFSYAKKLKYAMAAVADWTTHNYEL